MATFSANAERTSRPPAAGLTSACEPSLTQVGTLCADGAAERQRNCRAL